jgi:hypothetical protein
MRSRAYHGTGPNGSGSSVAVYIANLGPTGCLDTPYA